VGGEPILREMLGVAVAGKLLLVVGIAVVVVLGSWGIGNREQGTGSTLA